MELATLGAALADGIQGTFSGDVYRPGDPGYEEARNDIKPFMSGLKDIQTALSTDLTPGGVDAIKQSAGKVIDEGSSLKSTLSKLAGQFRDLGAAMSASVPQPAPAK